MVPKTRQLHKQLQYALIIQTIGPFFIGTIPTISLFLLSFANDEYQTFCIILSMCFSLITIVKPLAAILFIKPYRTHFTKIFFKKVWRSSLASTQEGEQSRPRPQTAA
uniref:G protein-coupled receptor n=1 Tax=Panagrolaimus sp. ES5 TaxID=591445 RepID=A0AC34GWA1_9BILA